MAFSGITTLPLLIVDSCAVMEIAPLNSSAATLVNTIDFLTFSSSLSQQCQDFLVLVEGWFLTSGGASSLGEEKLVAIV